MIGLPARWRFSTDGTNPPARVYVEKVLESSRAEALPVKIRTGTHEDSTGGINYAANRGAKKSF